MQVTNSGSVRVDLVGGTLDIEPINLILENVITLNVATSLKANVELIKTDFDGIEIHSEDYGKIYSWRSSELTRHNVLYTDMFKEMTFILQILTLFNLNSNLRINLSSGAPAGSGLGGSSAMGVTLYKALCAFTHSDFDVSMAVQRVKGVESRILNQGVAGYQDYYPALTGGILGIVGKEGYIEVEQLFTPELKDYLEMHLSLIYSGQSRASGINNWEVYKGFFDKNPRIINGLKKIAEISHQTYQAIKNNRYEEIAPLIAAEGVAREELFPGITTEKIKDFVKEVKLESDVFGTKMCGAGGGGCFLLVHNGEARSVIQQKAEKFGMTVLPFEIERPL
ncbi:MAG TPA: hypothetical protein VKY27_04010 [Bacteriovoracaceae bacterium]|nr:hypothetical protein [Bacteriovoracaceae bacterium]